MTGTGSGADTTQEHAHEEVVKNFRAHLAAMAAGDTSELGDLLTEEFTLTHMTGYVQSKVEWLQQMNAGQFNYQEARDVRVSAQVEGDTATLEAFAVVPATVYGSYAAWRLHFTMMYVRQDGVWLACRSVITTF